MSKRFILLLSLMLLAGMVLVSCTTESPAPETIIETRVVTEEVVVTEVVTEEVEVTRVVTEEVMVEAPEEPSAEAVTYDRATTLYTTGTAWAPPSDWNPVTNWDYSTGTIGYLYEPLFLYDPIANEMIPWLAESGEWIDEDTYEVKVREGMSWSDGEPITAADVKLTFELGQKFAAVPYSQLWEWLDSIEEVDDYTLQFQFSDHSPYCTRGY